jgi:hypothetical protein
MSGTPRLRSLAPQFLVDDLERSIAYYRDNEHLDLYAAVAGIDECRLRRQRRHHYQEAGRDGMRHPGLLPARPRRLRALLRRLTKPPSTT